MLPEMEQSAGHTGAAQRALVKDQRDLKFTKHFLTSVSTAPTSPHSREGAQGHTPRDGYHAEHPVSCPPALSTALLSPRDASIVSRLGCPAHHSVFLHRGSPGTTTAPTGGAPSRAARLPGFLGSSSPTGGRTVAGFSLAPRSPFLVTAPDVFWVPGRGALGEVPGALASPDMPVRSSATLGRPRGPGGETGLRGVRPGDGGTGDLYSAATARPSLRRRLRVPLHDNRERRAGGREQLQSARGHLGAPQSLGWGREPGGGATAGGGAGGAAGGGATRGAGRRRAGGAAEPQGVWNIPGAGPQSGRERSQGWSPREERGRELSKCAQEATALESGNPVKDRVSRRDLGRESWVGADPLSGVCSPVLKEEGSCWKRCGAGFLFSAHRISLWEVRAVGGSGFKVCPTWAGPLSCLPGRLQPPQPAGSAHLQAFPAPALLQAFATLGVDRPPLGKT